jgi:hypothetical protein
MQPNWSALLPVTRLNLDNIMFVCVIGVISGAEAWARSMSTLTQVVCTSAVHRVA